LWLLLRTARDDAIRGIAFADVALVVQRRRGTGPDSGVGGGDPAARTDVPLRGDGKGWDGDSLRAGGAYRVALDGGAGRCPLEISLGMARMECLIPGKRPKVGDAADRCRWSPLASAYPWGRSPTCQYRQVGDLPHIG